MEEPKPGYLGDVATITVVRPHSAPGILLRFHASSGGFVGDLYLTEEASLQLTQDLVAALPSSAGTASAAI